ncbi:ribosome recycling factor [Xanthobacter sp. DSM 24535]|uniref:ribosome recycling factor n=1 Tax=Roseixanthobacter psychrophilus TaxID=3119917 RepID=UPI003726B31B
MSTDAFDLADLKRRMQGAVGVLKQELGGLRTGRASASLLEPIQVDAYGTHMPISQVATVSVPEPRMLSVQVWDRSMVSAVERAIRDSNLGLNPSTEGQVMRIRIPELNQERRQEMVKVAHKYAEAARVSVRHVRRDGMDLLKKLEKDSEISADDLDRFSTQVQKATDEVISELDQTLAHKEKEILSV